MSNPMCGNCVYFTQDRDPELRTQTGTCHIKNIRPARHTAKHHFCHLHDYKNGRPPKTEFVPPLEKYKTKGNR